MEQFFTIELFGQKNKYATDIEIKKAQEIAERLVREVKKVEKQTGENYNNKLALLTIAALNITEQYIELENNYHDLSYKILNGSEKLLKKFNELDQN